MLKNTTESSIAPTVTDVRTVKSNLHTKPKNTRRTANKLPCRVQTQKLCNIDTVLIINYEMRALLWYYFDESFNAPLLFFTTFRQLQCN